MSDVWQGLNLDAPTTGWEGLNLDSNPVDNKAVSRINSTPDQAAKSIDVSNKINLPYDVTNADLPSAQQQLKLFEVGEALKNSAVRSYIENYPPAAEVSNDDWPTLQKIADFLKPTTWNGDPVVKLLEILSTENGRGKLWDTLKKYPERMDQGIRDWLGTPGKGYKEGLTEEEATSFGFNTSLALIGQTPRFGLSSDFGRGFMSSQDFLKGIQERSRGTIWRQEIDDFLAERAAKEAKPEGEQLALPPPSRGAEEIIQRTGQPPSAGADPAVTNIYGMKAHVDAAALDQAVADALTSKTLTRSPEAFAEFVKNANDETISIPATTLAEIYSKTPEQLAWLPQAREKIDAALTTGGDVEIKLGDYLANAEKLHEQVRDDVRVNGEGLTVREATEIADAPSTTMQDILEKSAEPRRPSSFIKDGEGTDAQRAAIITQEGAIFEFKPEYGSEGEWRGLGAHARFAKEAGVDNYVSLTGYADKSLSATSQIPLTTAQQRTLARLKAETKRNPEFEYIEDIPAAEEIKTPEQKAAQVTKEVTQAESAASGDVPLFASAEDAGMTETQFNLYRKRITQQQGAIEEKALNAVKREVSRRQTSEWKANEKALLPEVEKDLRARRDIAADEYLRTGKSDFGLSKWSPEQIKADSEGLGATIAEMFGFPSAEGMFKEVEALNKQRAALKQSPQQYFRDLANAELDARMEAKYGDLDANILKEARDLALSDLRLDILEQEFKALKAKASQEGEAPLKESLTKAEIGDLVANEFNGTL
jgi:hypothetical protein